MQEKDVSDNMVRYPMIPIREAVIFPKQVFRFRVGRKESLLALEKSLVTNKYIFLVTQRDPEIEGVRLF